MRSTLDIEYLVHRLYEDFDVISVYFADGKYIFWLGKWIGEGRVTLLHTIPSDFSVEQVEHEIERINIRYAEEEKRQSPTKIQ